MTPNTDFRVSSTFNLQCRVPLHCSSIIPCRNIPCINQANLLANYFTLSKKSTEPLKNYIKSFPVKLQLLETKKECAGKSSSSNYQSQEHRKRGACSSKCPSSFRVIPCKPLLGCLALRTLIVVRLHTLIQSFRPCKYKP